ncbi:MAG TPA: helix-turn-helix domain-containing protein [Phycisphaerae bacterium]|nr:helix-turn-helix domain-containing protein [Phycisphaerae bacterium]
MVIEPLLVGAAEAARLSGVSKSTWWSLHAQGKVPAPLRLGGRTMWNVEELRRWIEGGCPSRERWVAEEAAGKRVHRRA